MQIMITGKGIDLTQAIEGYVIKKIESLEKFYNQIVRAHVVVGVETRHHLKGSIFMAECKLEIPGNDIFVTKTAQTLYEAIDQLRDFLEKNLKKHKTKEREKTKKTKILVRQNKEYIPSL